MKSNLLKYINATTIFLSLAIPVQLVAQEQTAGDHQTKHQNYKLIDMGTFGGTASFVPFPPCCNPQGLNNRGTVAGAADTSTLDPSYPNFNPLLFSDRYIFHAFQWHEGALTDLGALAGFNSSSFALWISGNGLIAGVSGNGVIDPLTGFPEIRAVLWEDGQIIDLGTFGGNESYASAVNNRGQVVGFATNTIPDPFSISGVILGTQGRAFLWHDGSIQDLGTLGGNDAFAGYVNERGQVAGISYTNSIPNSATGIPTLDPFLWENGRMIDLGTLGGTFGLSNALNNRGEVVGQSNLAGDLTFHPFLWERGVLTDLGTFGGDYGVATWLNDAGAVIGWATNAGNQAILGFLRKHGALTGLGTVDGDLCSFPRSINSHGQIVGLSNDCQGPPLHAFLSKNGESIVDLNTRIPPNSTLQLADATSINDGGEIVGLGLPKGCSRQNFESCGHAYLLIPCDRDHPGVEGCDYDPVDLDALPESAAANSAQPPELDPSILLRLAHKIHN